MILIFSFGNYLIYLTNVKISAMGDFNVISIQQTTRILETV